MVNIENPDDFVQFWMVKNQDPDKTKTFFKHNKEYIFGHKPKTFKNISLQSFFSFIFQLKSIKKRPKNYKDIKMKVIRENSKF
jgi:hypothetical protein